MPIRLTGMTSGLDTEALVSELVSAYRKKTDKYTKAQTKLTWKQDAWKTMSSKTYSFRNKLDSLRFSSAYNLKTTSVSNTTKASITASNSAVNGTQSLNITSLAKSGYLTGGRLDGSGKKASEGTTLGDLGFVETDDKKATISLNGKKIELGANTTIKQAITAFKDAGVDANFDAANQRIFINAKESGANNDFSLTALDANGKQALQKLGLYTKSTASDAMYKQYEALSNAVPNGVDQKDWLKQQLENYNSAKDTIAANTKEEARLKAASEYWNADEKIKGIESGVDATTKYLLADSKNLVDKNGNVYLIRKDSEGKEYYIQESQKDNADPEKYYLTTKTEQIDDVDEEGNPIKKDVTTRYLSTDPAWNAIDKNALNQATIVNTADEYLEDLVKQGSIQKEDISEYRSALATKNGFDSIYKEEGDAYTARVDELKQKLMEEDPDLTEETATTMAEEQAAASGEFDSYFTHKSIVEMSSEQISEISENISNLQNERKEAQEFVEKNAVLASYADRYREATVNPTDKITPQGIVDELNDHVNNAVSELNTPDNSSDYTSDAVRVNGQDATIYLNGAQFTSSSNTFNINGLTINALATTTTEDRIENDLADEDAVTITTTTDNQGIYDKIKDFLSEYNSLINYMTASYNAASASDYEPLTDEEKEAMTDSQIEKWEDKGKSAVLRRDSTLSALMSTLTSAMSKSYTIDGKSYSLSNFGIKTLGILNAEKNEQNAYHIDGDADDDSVSGNADKLMAAIIDNPDGVMKFFQMLSTEVHSELGKKMTSTSMRTYGTFYNDKEMAKEYSDYTTTISKWEDKVADIEDSYYKKFAAMESALSKLQSQTSQLSGLLG